MTCISALIEQYLYMYLSRIKRKLINYENRVCCMIISDCVQH